MPVSVTRGPAWLGGMWLYDVDRDAVEARQETEAISGSLSWAALMSAWTASGVGTAFGA
jgi:hypothetical protein